MQNNWANPVCDPHLQRLRTLKRLLNARRAVRRAEDDGLLLRRLRRYLIQDGERSSK